MRRPISKLLLVVLAAVVVALVFAFLPSPVAVDLGRVERGELLVTVDEEGQTRVRDRYVIDAPVAGQLQRIQLKEGDQVEPGMLVARIDPLPLQAALEQAEAELAALRAEQAQAQLRLNAAEAAEQEANARVVQAQAALDQAQRERRRGAELVLDESIAPEEYELLELAEATRAAELEVARRQAQVAAIQAEIARAALLVPEPEQTDPDFQPDVFQTRIAALEAEIARLRRDLTLAEVRSPVRGQVLRVLQQSERYVMAGTPLLEVGDPRDIELVTDVLSTDAVLIEAGDRVIVDHWGGGHPLEARVRLVEPSGFTEVSALGVEEQRVNVIADFVGSPGPLTPHLPPSPTVGEGGAGGDDRAAPPSAARRSLGTLADGYRFEARIVVWEGRDVLLVPSSALFRTGDQWSVFAVEDGRARRRTIEVGHRNGFTTEVLAGLEEGDLVVLHPSDQIEDGVQVVPRRGQG